MRVCYSSDRKVWDLVISAKFLSQTGSGKWKPAEAETHLQEFSRFRAAILAGVYDSFLKVSEKILKNVQIRHRFRRSCQVRYSQFEHKRFRLKILIAVLSFHPILIT